MSKLTLPTGQRKLTAGMLQAAELYGSLPEGSTLPRRGQVLAALKSAAKALGIKPRLVMLIEALCTWTFPVDWTGQGPLLVWPSNVQLEEQLQVGPSQLASLIRRAGEAGLLVMRDGPRGKRYARRIDNDTTKPIEFGYGFSLTPLQARYDEFRRVAAAHSARLQAAADLRASITATRDEIHRLVGFALRDDAGGLDWEAEAEQAHVLWLERGKSRDLDRLMPLAARLEAARDRVHEALKLSKNGVMTPENRTPLPNTNPPLIASDTGGTERLTPPAHEASGSRTFTARVAAPVDRESANGVTRGFEVSPSMVVAMAPLFRQALELGGHTRRPTFEALWDVADSVRHHLEISRSAWTQACSVMGIQGAVIVLAVVAHKQAQGAVRRSPGGYFQTMTQRFLARTLRLDETLYGIQAWIKKQAAN